jgi:hypothetical protein
LNPAWGFGLTNDPGPDSKEFFGLQAASLFSKKNLLLS